MEGDDLEHPTLTKNLKYKCWNKSEPFHFHSVVHHPGLLLDLLCKWKPGGIELGEELALFPKQRLRKTGSRQPSPQHSHITIASEHRFM